MHYALFANHQPNNLMESVMNWNNKCAYIRSIQFATHYAEFDKSVQITGSVERSPDSENYSFTCSISLSEVRSFVAAIKDSGTGDIESMMGKSTSKGQVVPNLLILGKICSAINSLAFGRITDVQTKFLRFVTVGDALKIKAALLTSKANSSLCKCSFQVEVNGTNVVEGICNINRADHSEGQVNPLFALGLFSMIAAKLPGPGASFQTVDVQFLDQSIQSMPMTTLGSVKDSWRSDAGTQLTMDIFCMTNLGINAHATARVLAATSRRTRRQAA
jgi:hypothetical protein